MDLLAIAAAAPDDEIGEGAETNVDNNLHQDGDQNNNGDVLAQLDKRPYMCAGCGKRFAYKSSLTVSMIDNV